MKINSIAPQYYANQVKYIQNNNLENKTQKQAFNTNPNITSPIKQWSEIKWNKSKDD